MYSSYFDIILLFLSLMGWGMSIHHKLRIQPAFIPLFLFSMITCVVYGAGLLKLMPYAVYIIFYSGLFLFALYLFLLKKKRYKIKGIFTPGIVFFILFSIYCTLLLKGVFLLHYDNFSHWGLIVKEMFRLDSLPDVTTLVTFRNYPPGTAVFIYFIGKIIGYTESHVLMAQSYLISASLSVLFAFCRWKKPGYILLTIVAGLTLLLVIKNNIFDLLVDTLLGTVAIAVTVIAYAYKDNWMKNLTVNLPILVLLLFIKDIGKLFVFYDLILMGGLIYAYSIKGEKDTIKRWKITGISLFALLSVPALAHLSWVKYVEKAYPAISFESNKFAVSLDKITQINKSEEFIANLAPMITRAATDPFSSNFKSLLLLWGVAFLFFLVRYIKTRKAAWGLLSPLLLSVFYYIIYILVLYVVYLFLMPENEANFLAGFERYQSTIVIYCAGLLMISTLYEWARWGKLKISRPITAGTAILLCIIFVYPFVTNIHTLASKPDLENSVRMAMKGDYEKITSTGAQDPKVLYYSPKSENDEGYLYNAVIYEQRSYNFAYLTKSGTEQQREELLASIKGSNYLVILDADESIKQFLSENFHIENPNDVYEIKMTDNRIELNPLK
jgi:hypothetical protein